MFSLNMTEVDTGSSRSNEKRPVGCTTLRNELNNPADNGGSSSVFINHAVIAWHESRRKWIGDPSQRSQRTSRDPIISWSMTYEDLLSTCDPFSETISLTEMVDFLVDIWHDEGLFD